MTRRVTLPLLVAILLLGAFARLHGLTAQSLWLDEGYTHAVVTGLGPLGAALDDMHPPLYYIALSGWMAALGDSVFAMRVLSALFSIITLPLVYQLARHVIPDESRLPREHLALLATLLFVLSDPDIFMASEIRNYALHTLTVVLAVLGYFRWLAHPSRARWLIWVAATLAMIYTHYLGALIMGALGLHALLYLRGKQRMAAIGGLAISAAAFLPWALGPFLDQLRAPNPLFMPTPLTGEVLAQLLHQYFTAQWALVIGLLLLGAMSRRKATNNAFAWPDGPGLVLGLWVLLPFALIIGVNLFRPFVSPRWPFLVMPAVALLAARGLGRLDQPARGLVLAALLVYGVTTVDFYRPKPRWDTLAAHAIRYAQPGDVALMEVGNGDWPLGYYLTRDMPEGVDVYSLPRWRETSDPAAYPVEVERLLAEHSTVWLAAWGTEHDIFAQLANAGYARAASWTVEHAGNTLDMHRYDVPPPEPLAVFTSGMSLLDAHFYPDAGRLDLLWTATATPDADYTVSAFVLDAGGQLVAQLDSFPFDETRPTTSWQPGEVIFDPRPLDDVGDLPAGMYTVGVKLYTWWDGAVFPTEAGEEWFSVATFTR